MYSGKWEVAEDRNRLGFSGQQKELETRARSYPKQRHALEQVTPPPPALEKLGQQKPTLLCPSPGRGVQLPTREGAEEGMVMH